MRLNETLGETVVHRDVGHDGPRLRASLGWLARVYQSSGALFANAMISATDEWNSSLSRRFRDLAAIRRGDLGGEPIAEQRDLAEPLPAGGADEITGVGGRQPDLARRDGGAGGELCLEHPAARDG